MSEFNTAWIFSTDFLKYSIIKFYENPSSGAELFHADGRTDRWTVRYEEGYFEILRTSLRTIEKFSNEERKKERRKERKKRKKKERKNKENKITLTIKYFKGM